MKDNNILFYLFEDIQYKERSFAYVRKAVNHISLLFFSFNIRSKANGFVLSFCISSLMAKDAFNVSHVGIWVLFDSILCSWKCSEYISKALCVKACRKQGRTRVVDVKKENSNDAFSQLAIWDKIWPAMLIFSRFFGHIMA